MDRERVAGNLFTILCLAVVLGLISGGIWFIQHHVEATQSDYKNVSTATTVSVPAKQLAGKYMSKGYLTLAQAYEICDTAERQGAYKKEVAHVSNQ